MKPILASASPRRLELLAQLIPNFETVPANVDESLPRYPIPGLFAVKTASLKALAVSKAYPEQLVLGADTIVCIGARILGKPKDAVDNKIMLSQLSGRWHVVGTGVVVARGGKLLDSEFVVTRVLFKELSQAEIQEYVNTKEGLDKAGGYGIQGYAGKYVAAISGCYYNVVGLPMTVVAHMLEQ